MIKLVSNSVQGYLRPSTAATSRERLTTTIEQFVAVRKFVDALQKLVGVDSPFIHPRPDSADDWIENEYLWIHEVTENSITFVEGLNRIVGPIIVPTDIAKLAEPGWQLLCTAVRTDGTWQLQNVANGHA